jgi:hypothetical protein
MGWKEAMQHMIDGVRSLPTHCSSRCDSNSSGPYIFGNWDLAKKFHLDANLCELTRARNGRGE